MDDKLRSAVEELITAVDTQHLRGIRKTAFLCSAQCCDAKGTSHEELQGCVSQCQARMGAAEETLGREIEAWQGRLQRCAQVCHDHATATLGANPSPAAVAAAEKQVEACALKCVDEHIAQLGGMKRRLDEGLSKLR